MDKNYLAKYLKDLDPELKEFLLKGDWRKQLRKLCSDYGVTNEDLITNTENETFLVIIGIEYIGNFLTNLISAGLPKIQAEPLSEAIARDILFDVAEYLSAEEVEKKLPDAAVGLISDHEEIQKNPIKTTENKQQPVSNQPSIQQTQIPTPKPQPIQVNIQPKPVVEKPMPQIPTPPKITSVPNTQMSWEERKKKAEEALKNIAPVEPKKYPGGADPYREPV